MQALIYGHLKSFLIVVENVLKDEARRDKAEWMSQYMEETIKTIGFIKE
jgi:hypothetical protein